MLSVSQLHEGWITGRLSDEDWELAESGVQFQFRNSRGPGNPRLGHLFLDAFARSIATALLGFLAQHALIMRRAQTPRSSISHTYARLTRPKKKGIPAMRDAFSGCPSPVERRAMDYSAPPAAGTHQLSGAEISTPPISVRMRMRLRPAFFGALSSAVTRY
jgi:hypothetical protein